MAPLMSRLIGISPCLPVKDIPVVPLLLDTIHTILCPMLIVIVGLLYPKLHATLTPHRLPDVEAQPAYLLGALWLIRVGIYRLVSYFQEAELLGYLGIGQGRVVVEHLLRVELVPHQDILH